MLGPLLRSLRPPQWVKNLFVLAPLVFAEALDNADAAIRGGLAFVAFCAISSAVYLFNDVVDRERDRLHPVKRHRPLAAGTLKVSTAVGAAAGLAVGALAIGLWLGTLFTSWLLGYLALNVAYTSWLKHLVILDVMALSLCYVLRVLAGGAAIDVDVSTWLLLCTIFLALFLAFSKRRHELVLMAEHASSQRKVLSQYSPTFLDQMINVVTASTLLSYALYAKDSETIERFGTDRLIFTVPFVLFGIFRYLYLIYQIDDHRNPTELLLRDPPFLVNMFLWGAAILAIVYLQ